MDAFANQLTEVRNLDTEDEYTEQLNQLETEYQFILLRSLDLFHKEMSRSNLLERLHHIKKQLCDTNQGYPALTLLNILQHLLIAKGNTHNINANSFFFLLFKHPQERHLQLNLAL